MPEVKFTAAEARTLFSRAGTYGGVDTDRKQGSWGMRALREEYVLGVFKRFKDKAIQKGFGQFRLGPEDPEEAEKWTCTVNLHDDDRDGIYFILLEMIHPESKTRVDIMLREQVVWPIAQKIRKEKALRKELKLTETKGEKIENDDDPKRPEKEPEETPSSAPGRRPKPLRKRAAQEA